MGKQRILSPKNCDPSVRLAIQQLANKVFGTKTTPEFYGVELSGLTASQLVAPDSDKKLVSIVDLSPWIKGTFNQINTTDNGDGTVTLSLMQDYSDVFFSSITIQDADKNVAMHCSPSEFYITEYKTIAVGGEPRGLLLVLTKPA